MQTAMWPGPSQEMPLPAGWATRCITSKSLTWDGGVCPVRTGNPFGLHFPATACLTVSGPFMLPPPSRSKIVLASLTQGLG